MKRSAALAMTLLLGGCGFHPLYGGMDAGMSATLSSIYVEPVSDRLGYELRNTMIDLLDGPGTDAGAAYRLKLSLNETSRAVALQNDPNNNATITRYNDTLSVSYELTDRAGKLVTKGLETGLSSYNVLPTGPAIALSSAGQLRHLGRAAGRGQAGSRRHRQSHPL